MEWKRLSAWGERKRFGVLGTAQLVEGCIDNIGNDLWVCYVTGERDEQVFVGEYVGLSWAKDAVERRITFNRRHLSKGFPYKCRAFPYTCRGIPYNFSFAQFNWLS